MTKHTKKTPPFAMGDRVRVIAPRYENDGFIIAPMGTIERYIRSRDIIAVRLDNGLLWETLPENVRHKWELLLQPSLSASHLGYPKGDTKSD